MFLTLLLASALAIGYAARHFKVASRLVAKARSRRQVDSNSPANQPEARNDQSVAPLQGAVREEPMTSQVRVIPPAPAEPARTSDTPVYDKREVTIDPADHVGDVYIMFWLPEGTTEQDVTVAVTWDGETNDLVLPGLSDDNPRTLALTKTADNDGKLTLTSLTPACSSIGTVNRKPAVEIIDWR